MYYGGFLYCIKYGIQGIFNRQDKTGCKLLEPSAGIHECRRVGQKFKVCHCLKEIILYLLYISPGVIEGFCRSYVLADPPEHLLRRFYDPALFILFKITSLQDNECILCPVEFLPSLAVRPSNQQIRTWNNHKGRLCYECLMKGRIHNLLLYIVIKYKIKPPALEIPGAGRPY